MVLIGFFHRRSPTLHGRLLVIVSLRVFGSVQGTILPRVFARDAHFSSTSVSELLNFTLIGGLTRVGEENVISSFSVSLLLGRDVVNSLIVLNLQSTILSRVLLKRRVVSVSAVFRRNFGIGLHKRRPLVIHFSLYSRRRVRVKATNSQNIRALSRVRQPVYI